MISMYRVVDKDYVVDVVMGVVNIINPDPNGKLLHCIISLIFREREV